MLFYSFISLFYLNILLFFSDYVIAETGPLAVLVIFFHPCYTCCSSPGGFDSPSDPAAVGRIRTGQADIRNPFRYLLITK